MRKGDTQLIDMLAELAGVDPKRVRHIEVSVGISHAAMFKVELLGTSEASKMKFINLGHWPPTPEDRLKYGSDGEIPHSSTHKPDCLCVSASSEGPMNQHAKRRFLMSENPLHHLHRELNAECQAAVREGFEERLSSEQMRRDHDVESVETFKEGQLATYSKLVEFTDEDIATGDHLRTMRRLGYEGAKRLAMLIAGVRGQATITLLNGMIHPQVEVFRQDGKYVVRGYYDIGVRQREPACQT